ncbi:Putative ribonuclease H protein At1g65750, partial [Linum perenne]
PGPTDWTVLNTNGFVLAQTGNAAAGGLIRNNEGACAGAFYTNIGRCTITHSELRGVTTGLKMA